MAGRPTTSQLIDRVAQPLEMRVKALETGLAVAAGAFDRLKDRITELELALEAAPAPVEAPEHADTEPKPAMVSLKVARKSGYVGMRKIDRPDGEVIGKSYMVACGGIAEFDGGSPSIRIAARGGDLVPADAASKAWLEGLKA